MSLARAKAAFQDNEKHLSAEDNPAMHNLNTGLLCLAQGLESELQRMRREIQSLEQKVSRLRGTKVG